MKEFLIFVPVQLWIVLCFRGDGNVLRLENVQVILFQNIICFYMDFLLIAYKITVDYPPYLKDIW